MQDGKALQAGTSHDLGQNFAKAFGITYQTRDQELEHVFTTSWGVSTRLVGAVIMAHGDDQGLRLPPNIAPVAAVIVPIYRKDSEREAVLAYARDILVALAGKRAVDAAESGIGNKEILSVVIDDDRRLLLDLRDSLRPPEKYFWWEQRGVPLRIEVGPRDVAGGKAMVVSRPDREKSLSEKGALDGAWLKATLDSQQKVLFDRARSMRIERTCAVDSYEAFKREIEEGGFFMMHWDGSAETEAKVKAETRATIRCIPLDDWIDGAEGPISTREAGTDPVSGRPSRGRVLYARAY